MKHLLVVLVLAASATAAPPPEPILILKQVLELTDAQIEATARLLETRQAAVAPVAAELQALEPQLAALLESGSDPAAVGEVILTIRGLQQQIAQHQHAFAAGFRELLTERQRERLDAIEGVRAALRAGEALRSLGL